MPGQRFEAVESLIIADLYGQPAGLRCGFEHPGLEVGGLSPGGFAARRGIEGKDQAAGDQYRFELPNRGHLGQKGIDDGHASLGRWMLFVHVEPAIRGCFLVMRDSVAETLPGFESWPELSSLFEDGAAW
ncbi:hypothetical protein ELQ36_03960 [Methylococcus capsulatus]|nr:hypothetical protein [Methylococcus capsulatus]